jgi:hypothetical protein
LNEVQATATATMEYQEMAIVLEELLAAALRADDEVAKAENGSDREKRRAQLAYSVAEAKLKKATELFQEPGRASGESPRHSLARCHSARATFSCKKKSTFLHPTTAPLCA